jgi:hypothetical protein
MARITSVVSLVVLMAALVLLSPAGSSAKGPKPGLRLTPKTVELRLAMRDLWVGRVFWMRSVVVGTRLNDEAAARAAEAQVVENARGIARSLVLFYGREEGDRLFGLLAGHYGAVKDYMSAVFGGSKDARKAAISALEKNGDELAGFLSSISPNWPRSALVPALASHVALQVVEIDQINAKDFTMEAETWNAAKEQAYKIADILAEGVVKQFPRRF